MKMGKNIKAVILDWAGTTVDFGSMAPVAAFRKAFSYVGLAPEDVLIRRFMGMPKKDHVRNMLFDVVISDAFATLYGNAPGEKDVEEIYGNFEPALFDVLKEHAEPLPGVTETVEKLRKAGILIGSTTGYTKAMMDVLCPVSADLGYAPDCLVCPDDVDGTGRPYPYMLWENLRRLKIEKIKEVVKIGDTAVDILEGKNAGCLSIGVVQGSNMLGLSCEEYEKATLAEREELADYARKKYAEAGADHIIESFSDLPSFLESL